MMNLTKFSLAIPMACMLLAAGCSSKGGASDLFPTAGNGPIKIESDPSGADVYVMGDKLGVTPLSISREEVFPTVYPSEKVALYGRVTLRKSNCVDYTATVNMQISSNGLKAKLDCTDNKPQQAATPREGPAVNETAEQRLERIKDLLNKGLISEEEAKKARERILNEL
jgi:hypothetical protein